MDGIEYYLYLLLFPAATVALVAHILTGDPSAFIRVVELSVVPVWVVDSSLLALLLFGLLYAARARS